VGISLDQVPCEEDTGGQYISIHSDQNHSFLSNEKQSRKVQRSFTTRYTGTFLCCQGVAHDRYQVVCIVVRTHAVTTSGGYNANKTGEQRDNWWKIKIG
jgi:hypothetical protein